MVNTTFAEHEDERNGDGLADDRVISFEKLKDMRREGKASLAESDPILINRDPVRAIAMEARDSLQSFIEKHRARGPMQVGFLVPAQDAAQTGDLLSGFEKLLVRLDGLLESNMGASFRMVETAGKANALKKALGEFSALLSEASPEGRLRNRSFGMMLGAAQSLDAALATFIIETNEALLLRFHSTFKGTDPSGRAG